jgi:alkylhydroperoxidase family enzyme
VSGQSQDAEVDLSAVNGEAEGNAGVAHGAELLAFVEAVMGAEEAELAPARERLRAVLRPEAFVDACAVIGAFNVVDRIADSTGIPLDAGMLGMSAEVRAELDLERFGSSANTPRGGSAS